MTHVPRYVTSFVMVLVFAGFVAVALSFDKQARLMPLLVGVPGLLLAGFQLMKDIRREPTGSVGRVIWRRHETTITLWLVGCIVAVVLFGFAWGAPLMVAIYLHFILRERPWLTITGVILCIFVLELLLNRLLQAQLFEGLLSRLILRPWT